MKIYAGCVPLIALGTFTALWLSRAHDGSVAVPDVSHELVLTDGRSPGPVAVADFNRDAKDDVVVANHSSGTITILFGK